MTFSLSGRMRGLSAFPVALLIIFLGLLVKVLLATVPAYYDNFMLDKVIAQLSQDEMGKGKSVDQIRGDLSMRYTLNNVTVPASAVSISSDDSGLHFDVDYEVRNNIFGNLDVVMHFKRSFDVAGGNHSGN